MSTPPTGAVADPTIDAAYAAFRTRLHGYERLEPLARSRGPEKLAGIRALMAALGEAHRHGRTAHIAGTNGKGLTAAMLSALLHAAGHTVGLYTSPHVATPRERIGINGRHITRAEFSRVGNTVLDAADRLRATHHLSYFDLLTAMGWLAFRDAGVEWVVLETGLGGRSDATNIAPKELCILTRIGLDHLHVLGDTAQAIAGEKLGIVEAAPPGTPTVLAWQEPTLHPWLLERLADMGSPALEAPQLEDLHSVSSDQGAAHSLPRWACAAAALRALSAALGEAWPPPTPVLQMRMATALAVRLPGRLERRPGARLRLPAGEGREEVTLPEMVLDGGHNADSVAALAAQLRAWGIGGYTLLLSLQADKLVPPLLAPLGEVLGGAAEVLTLPPATVRAPSAERMAAFLREAMGGDGLAHTPCPDLPHALRHAAATGRPLVVSGSFWLLGDVVALLEGEEETGQ